MGYRLYIINPATGKTIGTMDFKKKKNALNEALFYRKAEEAKTRVRKVV